MVLQLVYLCLSLVGVHGSLQKYSLPSPWSYVCDRSNSSIGGHYAARCVKVESSQATEIRGLNACKMTCGKFGLVWPQPVEMQIYSDNLMHFIPQDFKFVAISTNNNLVANLVNKFTDIFKEYLYMKNPDYEGGFNNPFPEKPFISTTNIEVTVVVASSEASLKIDTNEEYHLKIELIKNGAQENLKIKVIAGTYFGLRHGLETLSQMISYDDLSDTLQIYRSAEVKDRPAYPHRGILVDTARNFLSTKVIKQIISGMSYDKLNVFHWHITDTHSFPMYSRRVPQLTLYGSYSPRKVYSAEDIKDIVEYAKVRGVRVLPEFDAPAHVGNGWQFGEKEGKGRLALCMNQEPWQDYCVEPPCGQLNPVNPNVYPILGKLYEDFFELFDTDMFHMGGDEVNLNCWNSSIEIREHFKSKGQVGTEEELLDLWNSFQTKAAEKVYAANQRKLPIILWTSRLTEKGGVEKYLNKDDYIIQIWTGGDDEVISELINKGYRVIFSNSDAWYMDCGYGAWVGEGNNWCSPYKGWQIVYDNSPAGIYRKQGGGGNRQLILGGEAAMWSEQVDGAAVIHKLWPRVSALGERLWSDPESNWKAAESRMVAHREDLVARGLRADALQPEWCIQNEGHCYVKV